MPQVENDDLWPCWWPHGRESDGCKQRIFLVFFLIWAVASPTLAGSLLPNQFQILYFGSVFQKTKIRVLQIRIVQHRSFSCTKGPESAPGEVYCLRRVLEETVFSSGGCRRKPHWGTISHRKAISRFRRQRISGRAVVEKCDFLAITSETRGLRSDTS